MTGTLLELHMTLGKYMHEEKKSIYGKIAQEYFVEFILPVVLDWLKALYVGFREGSTSFSNLYAAQQFGCRPATHTCGVTSLRVELKYLPTLINICQWIWLWSFLFGKVIKYGFNFLRKHRSVEMTYLSLRALSSLLSFGEITHLIQSTKFIGTYF